MRSSKSRSRSKSNRNRSMGNIVNRVFDSSGPEGKVRGTPQQIIDKYNQLARDAQLGNDRVAAENFQQHAEHYMRMLGEAMREQDQFRAQQERQPDRRDDGDDRDDARQHRQGGDDRGGDHRGSDNRGGENRGGDNRGGENRGGENRGGDDRNDDRGGAQDARRHRPQNEQVEQRKADDVIDVEDTPDAGLVETPENAPPKPKRTRRKKPESTGDEAPSGTQSDTPEAAE